LKIVLSSGVWFCETFSQLVSDARRCHPQLRYRPLSRAKFVPSVAPNLQGAGSVKVPDRWVPDNRMRFRLEGESVTNDTA
jgi:hypothetical protein